MLLIFICGWSASDRTGVAGAAASRDVRVILTAVTSSPFPIEPTLLLIYYTPNLIILYPLSIGNAII